jgi:hypothetical protein
VSFRVSFLDALPRERKEQRAKDIYVHLTFISCKFNDDTHRNIDMV